MLLLFYRTSDADMVANYRVQAELTAVESTPDGKALVLGTIDGCVSVLAIVDPVKNDMIEFIAEMPSRDEGVSVLDKYTLLVECNQFHHKNLF